MAVEIRVPELGESILTATIHQWFKQEGERVEVGEALLELETDKVNLEVGAEQAGQLAKIEHPAGDDVQVGDVLGLLEPLGERDEIRIAEDQTAQPEESQAEAVSQTAETGGDGKAQSLPSATPVAQRLASEQGLDLAQISGSGPGGRIFKEDVERFLESKPVSSTGRAGEGWPPPPQPVEAHPQSEQGGRRRPQPAQATVSPGGPRPERREKMSRRRRTIARRLVEAQQTAAMLTTFNEVDMGAVMALRQRRNPAFVERHGVKLGIVSFFIKAAIGALKAFPAINAQIEGDELVFKEYYDIGVAIGAPEGLVVPVLRDADRLSFAAIEAKIGELVEKTEQKTLALEDLQGGTFSITNGGVFGSLLSTPILNPPQSGILGLHKIEDRPVAVDGQVAIRPMMYIALSYDHRIVDGRQAVQFLVRVKELVEDPEAMLIEG
jgi:2-oxoglutarate dehydrogenase E2 component (dihydrolipoamide succinyltransferase)